MKHAAPAPQRGRHSTGLRPLTARTRAAVAATTALTVVVGGLALGVTSSAQADVLVTGRAIVGFEPGTRSARAVEVLSALGIAPGRSIDSLDARVVDLAPGMSQKLARSPGVAYVEPDMTGVGSALPDDPYLPVAGPIPGGEWGIGRTHAPAVWTAIGYGSPVTIAVLDSGVAAAHPDLQGQILTGRNVLDGTTGTTDTFGHGTSIAGVIAAATNNATGIAGYCGGCRILPVKIATGSTAYASDLANGITWAADQGARVLNISYVWSARSTTLDSAVAYARGKGAVVVAAAGNGGCDCTTYPAGTAGVIAVAESSNLTGDPLQGTSNYGAWVDVAAPGGSPTTVLNAAGASSPFGYAAVGGTSLSAPVVAGITGLLISASPTATGAALETALLTSTSPITGSHQVATGRVDAAKAYTALQATPTASPTPSPTTATPAPSVSVSPTSEASATPSSTPSDTATPTSAAPSPSPTDTSPSPASASPSATTTPTPSPSASTTTTTVVQSASLTKKSTSRTYAVTTAGARLAASLTYSCASLSLVATSPTGAPLLTLSGPGTVTGSVALPAGTSSITVGTSTRCSFTLTYSLTG